MSPALIRQIESSSLQDIPADELSFLRQLSQPSWIVVPGQDRSRQRIVTTLLHGNEPSGFRAIHRWLRTGKTPAVTSVFYIGSITTALADGGFAHRSLADQRDANRCYGDFVDDEQGRLAAEFTQMFQAEAFEALIDIHNNTGHNPVYGIGMAIDAARLNLAALFGDWFMHYDLSLGTLMEMSQLRCPSIAVECGRAGDASADAAAFAGLERFLMTDDLALDRKPPQQLRILEHPHRIFLKPDLRVGFGHQPNMQWDLCLRQDLDQHNFVELPAGSVLGWVQNRHHLPLEAMGAEGSQLGTELFDICGDRLLTRRPMVPVMMTMDLEIARSDCLFYAMTPSVC